MSVSPDYERLVFIGEGYDPHDVLIAFAHQGRFPIFHIDIIAGDIQDYLEIKTFEILDQYWHHGSRDEVVCWMEQMLFGDGANAYFMLDEEAEEGMTVEQKLEMMIESYLLSAESSDVITL